MRTPSDIQLRILREEFPAIGLDGDHDVEQYFDLRASGRQADALALYNAKLKRKYPDDARRATLLRSYRLRDGRYRSLYRESLVILADRMTSRVYSIIDFLTKDIASVNLKDAYSVIKLAEGLLSVISPDRYASIAFTERYARYAGILSHREKEMQETAELIRLYVTETIDSVEELKKERAERLRRQRARRQAGQSKVSFNLSKIRFSEEDVQAILIPASIASTEDQVIAYCLKYWNRVNDAAFEKTVFLYGRKYKTRHGDIFQAIKNGRTHGWKDEEILNAVLANIVSGYYYSISGDKYLQQAWARYKSSLAPAAAAVAAQTLISASTAPARYGHGRVSSRSAAKRRTPTVTARTRALTVPRRTVKPFVPEKTGAGKTLAARQPEKTRQSVRGQTTSVARPKAQSRSPARGFVPNSIADMIRKMTGKTYTVYQDLFFQSVRPSIRKVLADTGEKRQGIFGTRQNQAEEILFDFLEEHYNDPYQDWSASAERKKLAELGYYLGKLEPIIEGWIQDNR